MPDVLIGRERELATADEFLLAMARGGPAGLVLAGEPGIGKTVIWSETVRRARAQSFIVLTARGVEAEAGLSFAALADLLEPVADELVGELPDPQRRAVAVALLREEPGLEGLDRRTVAAATTGMLRGLARRRPVVVAVDDLQWLDRPSMRVLEFVVRRLGGSPVGVLVTERIEPGATPAVWLERAFADVHFRQVVLRPLSLGALHGILKQRCGRSFSRRGVMAIERTTGGNPFYALELAWSLPAGLPDSGSLARAVPRRLSELVEGRVGRLSPRARAVLLAAAALRSPTIDRVLSAAGGSAAQRLRALEEVEAAGIVVLDDARLRFTHPLFAAAVYSSAPAGDRRRLHRTLVHLLDDAEERARHLALSAVMPDAKLAAVLDAAAEYALARGAPESAAELTEQALRLTPDTHAAGRQRRTVQLAEYWFHAGDLQPAHRMLTTLLADVSTGRTRADALRLLGEIRWHDESYPEAIALFSEALRHAGDDAQLEAAIQLRLTFSFNVLGDIRGAEPHARRALSLARKVQDRALLAETLGVHVMVEFLHGRGPDAAELRRALELEDPHRQVAVQLRPSAIAGFLSLYVGELERSTRLLEAERTRLLDRGEDSDLPFISSALAWAECWRGNLHAAAVYAAETRDIAEQLDSRSARCLALAFSALVAAHEGDATTARRWAEQSLTLAMQTGFRIAAVWATWALGALGVALEDPAAADAALGPLATMVERAGVPEPIQAMFLADEIEALVALGHLERASALIDLLDQAGRRRRRAWALVQAGRGRAMLLAARGHLEHAAEAADNALAQAEGLELRLEVARTLLVAGQIERRRRRKRRARDLLQQALKVFDDAGAQAWARRARRDLERTAPPRAAHDLTPSERRVAELAASGLTNREVAARLFVSPKTVEANLARAYRKLRIGSRAELGARLSGRRTAQEP